jgi:putative membrane protein
VVCEQARDLRDREHEDEVEEELERGDLVLAVTRILDLNVRHARTLAQLAHAQPAGNPDGLPNRPRVDQVSVDEAQDATRRTRLANERTYLAWWRTGLTTFAVSLAAGKLVPELSSGAAWPFEVIGVAFAVVGLLFIAYAYVRQKRVEDALARGEYAAFETRAGLAFAALGVLLGIATIAVILAQPA